MAVVVVVAVGLVAPALAVVVPIAPIPAFSRPVVG